MLSILKNNDPSKAAFFMGTASGPCRFGQYCSYHRILLDRMGYVDVPIITATSSDSYTSVKELSSIGFQIDMLKAAIAGDVLRNALYRIRPYENVPGTTNRVMEANLSNLAGAMERGESLVPVLEKAADEFCNIERKDVLRPLVLMFGEIYVRNDPFAHSFTDRRIETYGGEVLGTPLLEWFEFVNYSFIQKSRDRKRIVDLVKGYSRLRLISKLHRTLSAPFQQLLSDRPSLAPEDILGAAEPYMKENVGGEAILCIGAPLSLAGDNAIHGAVNIFPFTCLPGTIVTAISKRIRKEHSNLPWLNLAFDGQEDTDNDARLEAFMFQVKQNFRELTISRTSSALEAVEEELESRLT